MSRNIILFRPATFKPEYFGSSVNFKIIGPPFGLLYVAAPLVERGYDIKIVDELFEPDYKHTLKFDLDNALCVGISAMTGEQIRRGLDFAAWVKSKSQLPVILGGLHATMLPRESLQNENIDIIVQGEGEESLPEIVQALEQNISLEGIKGCGYKTRNKIYLAPPRESVDLNRVPPLPFHLLKMENYIFPNIFTRRLNRAFMLCQSRGCPHDCKFCTTASLYNHKWRTKEAAQVVKEIKALSQNFNIHSIIFRDDNFFASKAWVAEFCAALLQENLDITWYANCRIDYWNSYEPEFIELLVKAGLVFLGFGIESGSQRVLDIIHKDLTLDAILRAHAKIEKYPINAQYFFMSGIPEENDQDTFATLRLINTLIRSGKQVISLTFYSSYPGIPLFEERKDREAYIPMNLMQWGEWDNRANKRFIPFFPMQAAAKGGMGKKPREFKAERLYYASSHYDFLINTTKIIDAMHFHRKALPWLRFRLFLIANLKMRWTASCLWDIKLIQAASRIKQALKARRSNSAATKTMN